jgi:hypothetical protein
MAGPGRSIDGGVALRIGRRFGWRVAAGPFAGLKYSRLSLGMSDLAPKILGCYELELHGAVEEVVARKPARLVNIGAAEGYYAVGLARLLPDIEVFAFESDGARRRLCTRIAALNGAGDRIELAGTCTLEALARVHLERALVICDIEGGELALLDPKIVPGLVHSDLIVELHDGLDPRITPTLVERFTSSHTITVLKTEPRDAERIGVDLSFLSQSERTEALEESRRISQGWLVATARTAGVS